MGRMKDIAIRIGNKAHICHKCKYRKHLTDKCYECVYSSDQFEKCAEYYGVGYLLGGFFFFISTVITWIVVLLCLFFFKYSLFIIWGGMFLNMAICFKIFFFIKKRLDKREGSNE